MINGAILTCESISPNDQTCDEPRVNGLAISAEPSTSLNICRFVFGPEAQAFTSSTPISLEPRLGLTDSTWAREPTTGELTSLTCSIEIG